MFTVRFPPLERAGRGFTRTSRRDEGMLRAGRPGFIKQGGVRSARGPGRRSPPKHCSQREWKQAPPSTLYNARVRWMQEPVLVSERCFFLVLSSSCPPMDYKYPRSPSILCTKTPSPHSTERERGLSKADGLDVFEPSPSRKNPFPNCSLPKMRYLCRD